MTKRTSETSRAPQELRPVGEVAESIFLGLSLARQPKGVMQTTPTPVVNVKDFNDGFLPRLDQLQTVDLPESSQTDRFRLQVGDVLLSARGSVKAVGVSKEQSGAVAGANLIVVRPGPRLAAPLMLAFFQHPSTILKLERLTAGTTVPSLNVSSVASLQIAVPPSEAQEKLARLVQIAHEHYFAARRAADLRLTLAQETAMKALRA